MSRCRIVLSRHVTEISSFEHAQKKKEFVDEARKRRHESSTKLRFSLIVILLVVISKYCTIYLLQSVSLKFSWSET